jgi:hypothetical protein
VAEFLQNAITGSVPKAVIDLLESLPASATLSNHMISFDRPDVVIGAIREVCDAVKSK